MPHVDAQLTENIDLRPTELKIDKRFVDGLPNDPTSAGLVRGVLGLARGMGLFTVAEGVENEEQAEFLSVNGCDSLRGFLTSPALPPDEALRFRVPSDASSADRVGSRNATTAQSDAVPSGSIGNAGFSELDDDVFGQRPEPPSDE